MPQLQMLRYVALAVAFFAVLAVTSSTANADPITFDPGSGNFPGDENILLNTAVSVTGNPVFGVTNNTNLLVRFTGAETLQPDGGQARIEAVDGAFAYLKIDVPGGTFKSLILNINAIDSSGNVHFLVTTSAGNFTFNSTLGNGNNFNRFLADASTQILSIEFWTDVGVNLQIQDAEDVRQVRIGGAQLNQVPEPASMLLLGSGLVGAAAGIRRRRRNGKS